MTESSGVAVWLAIVGGGMAVLPAVPALVACRLTSSRWVGSLVAALHVALACAFSALVARQLGDGRSVHDSAELVWRGEYLALSATTGVAVALAASAVATSLVVAVADCFRPRPSVSWTGWLRGGAALVGLGVLGSALGSPVALHLDGHFEWVVRGGLVATAALLVLVAPVTGRADTLCAAAEALGVVTLCTARLAALDVAWQARSLPITRPGFDASTYPLVALGVTALGVAVVGAEPGWRRIVVLFATVATLLATAFM